MTAFARTIRCASVAGVNEKCPEQSPLLSGRKLHARERYLSFRRQSGMAAGKDETEAVVLDFLILMRRLVDARLEGRARGLSGAGDSVLSERCRAEDRVLMTLDLDFANVQANPCQYARSNGLSKGKKYLQRCHLPI